MADEPIDTLYMEGAAVVMQAFRRWILAVVTVAIGLVSAHVLAEPPRFGVTMARLDVEDPLPTGDRDRDRDKDPIGELTLGEVRSGDSPLTALPTHGTYADHEMVFGGEMPLPVSSGEWLDAGRWYVLPDFVMLHRNSVKQQLLSANATTNASGDPVPFSAALDTDASAFGYEPGMKITIGRWFGRDQDDRDHSIDFTFMGLQEWSASSGATALTNFFLVTPSNLSVGGFTGGLTHRYTYKADFDSYEVNFRTQTRLGRDQLVLRKDGEWQQECSPGKTWAWFGGFRFITADEHFTFSSDAATRSADVRIATHNDLAGLQVGLEATDQYCNWNYGARVKIGGLVNFADQSTQATFIDTFFITPNRDEFADDQQLTLLTELSLMASYQFRPNVALKLQYDFVYLQGVAMAPEQLTFETAKVPGVNTNSFYFLDGASVGVEWIW